MNTDTLNQSGPALGKPASAAPRPRSWLLPLRGSASSGTISLAATAAQCCQVQGPSLLQLWRLSSASATSCSPAPPPRWAIAAPPASLVSVGAPPATARTRGTIGPRRHGAPRTPDAGQPKANGDQASMETPRGSEELDQRG